MLSPTVTEIHSARVCAEKIVDPIKTAPMRLDDETRAELREKIQDAYRYLMAEPSPIL